MTVEPLLPAMLRLRRIFTFRRSVAPAAAALLVAQIPFELRYTWHGLTNLQWSFVVVALVGIPVLIQCWKTFTTDRLAWAAVVFVLAQWAAAIGAPEFQTNAFKAAVRFSVGLVLWAVVRGLQQDGRILRTWSIASAPAAIYALIAYAGFGVPWLFRSEEFYLGQVQRLSGSFEYPNTAAAYYAMSLPIVSRASLRPAVKWTLVFLLWCALILTFSRSALVAALIAAAAGWKLAPKVLGIGAGAYLLLLPFNPYWFGTIHRNRTNPIAVEYKTAWNRLQQSPAVRDAISIQIRNTGFRTWHAQGRSRVAVAYRWLNADTDAFLGGIPLITPLPRDVEPGEAVEVTARFQTPPSPGTYILALELFSGDFDWFSRLGFWPVLVEADIRPGVERSAGVVDLSARYHRGQSPAVLTASVSRLALWRAAFRMFLDRPLGVGPDNFRLEYGRYLHAGRWDTHISSNNLYLELLTGSGLFGLAAFVLLLAAIRWRVDVPCLVVITFLVHGLADVFFMATPIYFAFWTCLAMTAPFQPPRQI
jgi:O-antigen ligase